MSKNRIVRNAKDNFHQENERGSKFLAKLQKITQDNKSRKGNTKIRAHKYEWMQTNLQYKSKEQKFTNQINEFLLKYSRNNSKIKEEVKDAIGEKVALEKKTQLLSFTLFYQIGGLRSLVQATSGLEKDFQSKKKNPELKKKYIERIQSISQIRNDIKKLLNEIDSDLQSQLSQYKEELDEQRKQIGPAKMSDHVRGFDLEIVVEDTIDEFLQDYEEIFEKDEYNKIKQEYDKGMSLLKSIYEVEFKRLLLQLPSQYEDVINNFPEDDYIKIIQVYKEYILRGKPREKYYERLMIDFENLSREDLFQITDVIESQRNYKAKTKALYRDLQREKYEFKEKTMESIKKQASEIKQQLIAKLKATKQEKKIRQVKEEHEENVWKFEAKMKIIKEIEEKRKEEEIKNEQLKKMQYDKHVDQTKFKAKEFINKRNNEIEMNIKRQNEIKAQEKLLGQQLVEANKPKVEQRHNAEKDKLNLKIAKIEEKKVKQTKNQQRIDNAVESYKFRPKPDFNEDRLRQATESKIIKAKTKLDKADNLQLFRNDGFNIDQLMKDIRYKISTTLSEAGVMNTTYAHQLLKQTETNLQPRTDTFTTYKQ